MRGLKKFKRLAKQDFLVSPRTSEPIYWRNHAVARRNQYTQFMENIERNGVDGAYQQAINAYALLPRLDKQSIIEYPEIAGREQAFHLFFDLLGIDKKTATHLRNQRKRPIRTPPETATVAPAESSFVQEVSENRQELGITQKSS